MKAIAYIMILTLMLMAPVIRLDISKLEPVEAVAVTIEEGNVRLETDTGSIGRGKTVSQALEDLKTNATLIIYLDTAQYLLVGDGAEETSEELRKYLSKSVITARYNGGEIAEEVLYLNAHRLSSDPS